MVIVALDHVVYYVVQNLAAQLIVVIVSLTAIERFGVFGAAAAGICAQLLLYATTTVFLKRRYGAQTPRRTVTVSVYVLIAIVVSGAVGMRWSELTPFIVGIKVSIYVSLLLGLVLLMSPSQRGEVADAMRRMRARVFP